MDSEVVYVAGEWRPPRGAGRIAVVNPATEEELAVVADGSGADVDDAVAAARAALPEWSARPAEERAAFLRLMRRELLARREEFAATVTAEMGAPIALSRHVQTGLPLRALGGLLDALTEVSTPERLGNSVVLHEPVGVVAALTPWNYPLHQVVAKLAAAIAVGCTVVLKPSELAPLSAMLLTRVLHEVDLPAGVVNLVTGGVATGDALVGHPGVDLVSFTGSAAVGALVAARAGALVRPLILELGGKSANVVLPDADLPAALEYGVTRALANSGQTCTALSRMLVPRKDLDEARQRCTEFAAQYVPGDPTDPGTLLGPLVTADHRDRVRRVFADAAAEGVDRIDPLGDRPLPERGYYLAPSLFVTDDPDLPIVQDEIFGPALCLLPYDTEEEALAITNNSRFGLAGAVWSTDRDHAVAFARGMRVGRVDINGAPFNPAAPFGGRGLSGYGHELGRFGLREYQVAKAIGLPDGPAARPGGVAG
ncbi:aldehyde dehydrogenase family protein [Rugosimonospora africana]|uniref:aldehyde dehydrogenase (NAD(+)) n=1 Tax=Rugosimonospora africana TaxID=556532 RepID=A0A8J3VM32_9ACTN|nr:aldehyde dehydrogenase family protein [Rugosimonospora africana]GIH11889.1 aldehyde dehydrogenase [Rugosimonospora africana]